MFLGGLGRSGSTLVERVLARAPGVCAVGELVFLWERGLAADERCGCGRPLRSCPFWTSVGERAVGGWDRLDLGDVLALKARVDRNRYLPLLLAPWLSARFRGDLRRYASLLGRIYAAVAAESGASLVVDTSKHASTAALLRHVPGIRPRVAQVVRDPRGVAYSWAKVVERPDVTEGSSTMSRLGPGRIAARWLAYDALLELVRRPRRGGLLRYETFVDAPEEAAARLLAFAGHDPAARPRFDGRTVTLAEDHTVAGNPLRFRTGELEIRHDTEWRARMAPADRRLVGVCTLPLRLAYGYR